MFVRGSLLLLAALVVGAPSPAQEPKVLELKPRWKRGDLLRYDMTRTVAREVDGKEVRKFTTRTPVEVEIIDVDEDGTILRWTQGSTVHDDPKFDDDPLARATGAIAKGLDVDIDLDPDGVFVGVRNWKELRGTGLKVQDAILAQMAKAGATKATIEGVRKETEKLFETEASIEAAFTRNAALLVFPFGEEYELGKATPYNATIPNVFGGPEPFPALGEFVFKGVDRETGLAVIVFKQTLDEEQAPRVLRKWLEENAKQSGKPAPKELPEVEINEVIEYEIDLAAGWVKAVTLTRVAKDGMRTQTETITLTRKMR